MFTPDIKKVPLKKETVYVREISAYEQRVIDEYALSEDKKSYDNGRYNRAIVATSLCDEKGKSQYSMADVDAIDTHFSIKDYMKVVLACVSVNGLDESIEDLAGKS